MAKLRSNAICDDDLIEFIEQQSDFAFELRVYRQLRERGFDCEHGGTYEDPISKKIRQFDIRATRTIATERLRLAVECKHLHEHFPLVILRVPRQFDESVHEIILSVDTERFDLPRSELDMLPPSALTISVQGRSSIYAPEAPVGKSCAQVGRDVQGTVVATDSEMFGKWTQAISSAQSLAEQASEDGGRAQHGFLTTLVLPIVVVPDGRLWAVDFDSDGSRCSDPIRIDHCSYLINRSCQIGDRVSPLEYKVSHLEFVTNQGLDDLIAMLVDERHRRGYFDLREVQGILRLHQLPRQHG